MDEQIMQIIRQAIIEFMTNPLEGESLSFFGFTMTWKAGGAIGLYKPGGAVELWEFSGNLAEG